MRVYMYMHIRVCIYTYSFFVTDDLLGQCQWDTNRRARRELSNALVKMISVLQMSKYGSSRFGMPQLQLQH